MLNHSDSKGFYCLLTYNSTDIEIRQSYNPNYFETCPASAVMVYICKMDQTREYKKYQSYTQIGTQTVDKVPV